VSGSGAGPDRRRVETAADLTWHRHGADPRLLEEAYRACARLARRHYENFPVASRLLPPSMRPHVAAVYAFARIADDFADEGNCAAEERHRLLDDWLERLRRASQCRLAHPAGETGTERSKALVFVALGQTLRECGLPVGLFEDLISAFRQDIATTRYNNWVDLLDYCRRSANPVGRLVLRIAGHHDPVADHMSDCLCTGLQLANFWQDLRRDWERGRLYVPLEDVRSYRAEMQDLERGHFSPEWSEVVRQMVMRTREFFDCGRPVCDAVGGRLRVELRLTWLGGRRILDKLERRGNNPFASRPALRPWDLPVLLWRAARWES
jgi:hydroxysqualene synthase